MQEEVFWYLLLIRVITYHVISDTFLSIKDFYLHQTDTVGDQLGKCLCVPMCLHTSDTLCLFNPENPRF